MITVVKRFGYLSKSLGFFSGGSSPSSGSPPTISFSRLSTLSRALSSFIRSKTRISRIKLLKGFNDLKTKYPSLAAEWSEKNLPLTPDAVNEKSTKNVWWKCRTCGYEWKAVVKARVKGGMCPVCAERAVLQGYNDLGTTDPHLLSEWDYEKNSKWTPSNVSRNSMKVVWWKCGAGHSYRAKITDRTIEQKGCPQCEAEFQQALPQMLIMMYSIFKVREVFALTNQLGNFFRFVRSFFEIFQKIFFDHLSGIK